MPKLYSSRERVSWCSSWPITTMGRPSSAPIRQGPRGRRRSSVGQGRVLGEKLADVVAAMGAFGMPRDLAFLPWRQPAIQLLQPGPPSHPARGPARPRPDRLGHVAQVFGLAFGSASGFSKSRYCVMDSPLGARNGPRAAADQVQWSAMRARSGPGVAPGVVPDRHAPVGLVAQGLLEGTARGLDPGGIAGEIVGFQEEPDPAAGLPPDTGALVADRARPKGVRPMAPRPRPGACAPGPRPRPGESR